jgi:CheY-like chemotaxis protein
VDVDADTRELYRLSLAPAGYNVQEAADGRDALAQVYSARPDVLIVDAQLPFIDGCELCRLLRSDPETARLPLVLVTANPLAETVQRLRVAGVNSILVKPFPPEALLREVTLLEDGGAAATSEALPKAAADGTALSLTAISPRATAAPAKARGRNRFVTRQPSLPPPELRCPSCDRLLQYDRSHVGGVGARGYEQWDYFVCAQCGTYQYRHRTRKLRHVS